MIINYDAYVSWNQHLGRYEGHANGLFQILISGPFLYYENRDWYGRLFGNARTTSVRAGNGCLALPDSLLSLRL